MSKNVWVKVMYVVVPLVALGLGVLIGAVAFGKDSAGSPTAATDAAAQPTATVTVTPPASAEPTPTVDPNATIDASVTAPKGATPQGGIAFGTSDAPVVVQVFFDYMCPYCGKLETANGADLEQLAEAGKIQLIQHPLSFLDRASSTEYSTRAANAFATAANADLDAALKFSQALFANQPAEGGAGLDDAKLAELATQAGVPDAAVKAFGSKQFVPWVQATTNLAFNSQGITGTPTVLINGQKFEGDIYSPGTLKQAIDQLG